MSGGVTCAGWRLCVVIVLAGVACDFRDIETCTNRDRCASSDAGTRDAPDDDQVDAGSEDAPGDTEADTPVESGMDGSGGCAGCVRETVCLPGAAVEACGVGGAACIPCPNLSTCELGVCVPPGG